MPAEQLLAEGVQLCLSITGGGEAHIGGILLTKASLRVHEGVQQCFIAPCQTNHGLIDRHISVGVQLHGSTYDIGTFDLGVILLQKSHFVHGIKKLSV